MSVNKVTYHDNLKTNNILICKGEQAIRIYKDGTRAAKIWARVYEGTDARFYRENLEQYPEITATEANKMLPAKFRRKSFTFLARQAI